MTVGPALGFHRAALGAGLDGAPRAGMMCIIRCRTNALQRTVWNGFPR